MRIGYSLTTSELVQAEHAEYGDCAKFQITCPCCREAVFKGRRERPAEVHYFSHYRSDAEEARLCELRVARLAKAHIPPPILQSHGQTLHAFMSAFRESVIQAQADMGIVHRNVMQKDVARILARPDFAFLEAPARELTMTGDGLIQQASTAFNLRDDLAEALGKMPPFKDRSPFWLRRQASYAIDILSHLRTEQGAPNFRFLVACGYSVLARRPDAFGLFAATDAIARTIARAVCEGCGPAMLRQIIIRETFTDAKKKGWEAGHSAAQTDVMRMRDAFGWTPAAPVGRRALLSSAGGATFAAAARVSVDMVETAIKHHIAQLSDERVEIESKREHTVLRAATLSLIIELYAPILGLVASPPYIELLREMTPPTIP